MKVDLDAVLEFVKIIDGESDRGQVLVSVSIIDAAFEDALRAEFKRLSGTTDKQIDRLLTQRAQAPIGALAVRIQVAFVLGMIDDRLRSTLVAMKDMRNDAAHIARPFSFADHDLSFMYDPLSEPEKKTLSAMVAMMDRGAEPATPAAKNRVIFTIVSIAILIRLMLRARGFTADTSGVIDRLWEQFQSLRRVPQPESSTPTLPLPPPETPQ